jgi:hypothetical protein
LLRLRALSLACSFPKQFGVAAMAEVCTRRQELLASAALLVCCTGK